LVTAPVRGSPVRQAPRFQRRHVSMEEPRLHQRREGKGEPVLNSSSKMERPFRLSLRLPSTITGDWKSLRSLPSQTPRQDLSPYKSWLKRKNFEERAGQSPPSWPAVNRDEHDGAKETNLFRVSVGKRPRIISSQLPRHWFRRVGSRFQYALSYIRGSSEGYKVNSRMGRHPGPKIMAAGHDIEDPRWKQFTNIF